MSYHLREIKIRGTLGELSKLHEELDELTEALEQDNKILALCELADLYGAIEAFAENLGTNMKEIAQMAQATKRAFQSSSRK
jgi:hypothetical protein